MTRLTNTFPRANGSRGSEPQLGEPQYGWTYQRGQAQGEQTQ